MIKCYHGCYGVFYKTIMFVHHFLDFKDSTCSTDQYSHFEWRTSEIICQLSAIPPADRNIFLLFVDGISLWEHLELNLMICNSVMCIFTRQTTWRGKERSGFDIQYSVLNLFTFLTKLLCNMWRVTADFFRAWCLFFQTVRNSLPCFI